MEEGEGGRGRDGGTKVSPARCCGNVCLLRSRGAGNSDPAIQRAGAVRGRPAVSVHQDPGSDHVQATTTMCQQLAHCCLFFD